MNIHIVKSGEGLGSVALRYAVSETELRLVNRIKGPGPLIPGQSLFIPGDAPIPARSIELCAFSAAPAESSCGNSLTYICPYSHRFDEKGALIPPDFEFDISALRRCGCASLLCLTNLGEGGAFSPELAHMLFCSGELRSRLFEELLSELKAKGYYGLQLCFNYLFPFDRDNYSAFVHELSEALHKEGFCLSLELVPPDIAAHSAALDYAVLGSLCDRLSLMFCRWGHSYSPPQPLSPINYIRRALDSLCPLIPPGKLLLGISGCGFDWRLPWRQGDCAALLSNSLAAELAMSQAVEIAYDNRAQAPFFDYRDAAQCRHRVYFEDARSISAKLDMVEEYGLAGIALYSWERELRRGDEALERLYNAEKLL